MILDNDLKYPPGRLCASGWAGINARSRCALGLMRFFRPPPRLISSDTAELFWQEPPFAFHGASSSAVRGYAARPCADASSETGSASHWWVADVDTFTVTPDIFALHRESSVPAEICDLIHIYPLRCLQVLLPLFSSCYNVDLVPLDRAASAGPKQTHYSFIDGVLVKFLKFQSSFLGAQ